ncbi:MAG: class II fructose-bisphosphatase [Rickettsiaceae bacterium]
MTILRNHDVLDIAYVTEQAAIAAYQFFGLGDEFAADKAAVSSMRNSLNSLNIHGKIVIGEGQRDNAPMLYIGEEFGSKTSEDNADYDILDIAVDPLEGTTILSHGADSALSVIAVAQKGTLLNAPDVYMEKIAIGFQAPEDLIDLDKTPKENLYNIAQFKQCKISDLLVTILNRKRHEALIKEVRDVGARIKLIQDGDISPIVQVAINDIHDGYTHVSMGIGGAPEGVLAAAALKCSKGQIKSRMLFNNSNEQMLAKTMGIDNFAHQYNLQQLVSGHVYFVATGVTNGSLLKSIRKDGNQYIANSLIMNSYDKITRKVESIYSI